MALAGSLPPIKEPLFGLRYSSQQIKFDPVPAKILSLCGLDANPKTTRRAIYAGALNANWHYLIIGGLVRDFSQGADAPWESDDIGEFLRYSATSCNLIDPADEVFYAPGANAVPVPMTVFSSLAKNAVDRYTLAYGSRARLLAALRAQHARPNPKFEPLLAAALANPDAVTPQAAPEGS